MLVDRLLDPFLTFQVKGACSRSNEALGLNHHWHSPNALHTLFNGGARHAVTLAHDNHALPFEVHSGRVLLTEILNRCRQFTPALPSRGVRLQNARFAIRKVGHPSEEEAALCKEHRVFGFAAPERVERMGQIGDGRGDMPLSG